MDTHFHVSKEQIAKPKKTFLGCIEREKGHKSDPSRLSHRILGDAGLFSFHFLRTLHQNITRIRTSMRNIVESFWK